MKIRSQAELQEYLDRTLAWRKRELTTVRFAVQNARREHEKAALLRAALPLLYAHWEGYVKGAAVAYLEYVSRQQLMLRDLQNNFVAIAVRKAILTAGESRKVRLHKKIVDEILDNLDSSLVLSAEGAVDTEANLSSAVLREIMEAIGLEFNVIWQAKIARMDQSLLKSRNEIVHGEQTQVDMVSYDALHVFVLESLEQFKSDLESAASTRAFRKHPSAGSGSASST